ncbi:MAG TPA: TIGR03557 family F420-dependent LLM class oxidoreductase [Dehalococcoidia bacterium]|nr:TIGR03557 family F420-dependent LLM class oxidoreductase [Dehalococcoidia bacterium]
MIEIGIALSSEELGPDELVRDAAMAEDAGFAFAAISDHFHPWTSRQGQSPFVWAVLGGIASATNRLEVGTMVTCPTIRTHPAIVAQAAATTAAMMPGRFYLGLGSGENLNEHITGDVWPRAGVRIDMLEEAVEIIRRLWTGHNVSYDGAYFTLSNARIYTLPDELPPIYMAAAAPRAAHLAGRVGDGLITTSADGELVQAFSAEGNKGPKFGQLAVCIEKDDERALKLATELWPTSVLKGSFKQELALPKHFEEATSDVTRDQVAKEIICTKDVRQHVEAIQQFAESGFDRLYIRATGDFQLFLDFYRDEVMPALQGQATLGPVRKAA